MLILKLALCLIHLLFPHPFIHIRLVKVLILVTRKLRRRRKMTKKKKQNKQGGNQATISTDITSMDKSSNHPRKVKFPCMLCKGNLLLRDCTYIPKVLEVWSIGSHRPLSSTYGNHAGDKSSTSDSKVHWKKGKVKFPCKLCEGNHPNHLFPYMDEDSKVF